MAAHVCLKNEFTEDKKYHTAKFKIIIIQLFQHPVAIKELKRLKIVIEALKDQVRCSHPVNYVLH